jgi:CheY-like chemotaxis protein
MLAGREYSVLIIEKEVNSAQTLRDWVFRNPVVPVFVSSGIEALLWLGKGNIPDLILADAEMQEPVSGSEFIRTLKASGFFHEIPIVVFGNPDRHPEMAMMRQAGAAEHIFLSVEPQVLYKRLETLIFTEVKIG